MRDRSTTLRNRVLGVYLNRDWISDKEVFANPVLVGMTKKDITDTLYKIKFNHTVYTMETKKDGGVKFRRAVRRENGSSLVVSEENGQTETVKEQSEAGPVVDGTRRRQRKSRFKSKAAKECSTKMEALLQEGKSLASQGRYTISPTSILRIFVLLERQLDGLNAELAKI